MATRSAGSGIVLDLSSQGATTIQAAPGSSQIITLTAPKLGVNGNYPKACRIVVRVQGLVDNSGGEGAQDINWDHIAKVVTSFNTECPLFGTIHKADAFTGPRTKHVIEYLSGGFNYYGGIGGGLIAGESPSPIDICFALPFSNEAFFSPLDFAPWVGWLAQLQLTVNLADADVFDAVSTDAVIVGNLSVSAWIEAVPAKTLSLPTINQYRVYTPSASGGGMALLQNVGQAGGLSCVVPGSRVAAILEMMNVIGLGGASTGDNYTKFSADQLNQPPTNNVQSFVNQFQMMRRQSVVGGRQLGDDTTGLNNQAGNPYTMSNELMFMPWRVPGADAEIGSQQKFMGNLTLDRSFGSTPNSGEYVLITNELRQLSDSSAAALLEAASVSGARANQARREYYDGPASKQSSFALPVRIPNNAAK